MWVRVVQTGTVQKAVIFEAIEALEVDGVELAANFNFVSDLQKDFLRSGDGYLHNRKTANAGNERIPVQVEDVGVVHGNCFGKSRLLRYELILAEVFRSRNDSLGLEVMKSNSDLAIKHVEQPEVLLVALEDHLALRVTFFLETVRELFSDAIVLVLLVRSLTEHAE